MLAYSYLRFSTKRQSKGDSFRRQLEKSEKYALVHGLTLDRTFKLCDPGVSAFDKTNVTKGKLGGFLKAIEEGRIPKGSYLLVESLDRLSRAQVLDALQQFIAILNAGIVVVTIDDDQVYSKESVGENFSQLFVSIGIMQRAHEESIRKSRLVGAAWKNKLQNAIDHHTIVTKNVPFWMKVNDGKIELISERAEVVRRIFQWIKEGLGQNTIARQLNKDVPAWNIKGVWHISYIHKLTQNHAVYGAFEAKGVIVDGYYPAVISKEEFFYVQKLRSQRRTSVVNRNTKGVAVTNLFSGISFCGYCGAKMVIGSSKSIRQKKEEKFLVCYGARTAATNCSCVKWNYREIEAAFLLRVSQLDFGALFGMKNTKHLEELEERFIKITSENDFCTRKIGNIYKAIEEDPVPGLVSRLKDLERQSLDLKEEKEKIEFELATEKLIDNSGSSRMKNLIFLFNRMNSCTTDIELRAIRESLLEQVRTFVEKLVLYPTGPILNKNNRDMRFMRVFLKSGCVVELE